MRQQRFLPEPIDVAGEKSAQYSFRYLCSNIIFMSGLRCSLPCHFEAALIANSFIPSSLYFLCIIPRAQLASVCESNGKPK